MKQRIVICAVIIVSVLIISGCAEKLPSEEKTELSQEALQTKQLIEQLSKEKGLTGEEEANATSPSSLSSTKELLDKLSRQAGLVEGEEPAEEMIVEEEDIPPAKDYTIVIDLFKGDPEDLTIRVNSTVTWVNNHPNFIHMIGIREKIENGRYDLPVTEKNRIYGNETFTYQFNNPGLYQWYSSTKYPDSSGFIEVKWGSADIS